MPPQPLQLIDSGRTEFGYARTVCSCSSGTLNCRHLPCYLVPADLDRIFAHLAAESWEELPHPWAWLAWFSVPAFARLRWGVSSGE